MQAMSSIVLALTKLKPCKESECGLIKLTDSLSSLYETWHRHHRYILQRIPWIKELKKVQVDPWIVTNCMNKGGFELLPSHSNWDQISLLPCCHFTMNNFLETRRRSRVKRRVRPEDVAPVRRRDDRRRRCDGLRGWAGCRKDRGGLERLEARSQRIAICTWHLNIAGRAGVVSEVVRRHQQMRMILWYHGVSRVTAGALGLRVAGGHQAMKVELVSVALAVHLRHDGLVVVIPVGECYQWLWHQRASDSPQSSAQFVVVHVRLVLLHAPSSGDLVRIDELELAGSACWRRNFHF